MREFLPDQDRTQRIMTALKSVAGQTGCNLPQVGITWLRHSPVPVIPILGARKVSQLQDNLASLDLYNKELIRGLAYGGMRDHIIHQRTVTTVGESLGAPPVA